ncbi:MAG: glycoside hydrolase family 38 C-terminal domain-containing protein [Eubacterium sp.]
MGKKRIYTVATSHLDTIWSWDFETTVSKYIYNTLVDNFALFKKYPSYTFSFEGSYRYELMEEYYPELFEQLKEYIKEGRWHITGSAYENGDVNCPSPEALFRNILFGNSYFDEKFGKRSLDIYLPDCFGFGWALPSIANHANLCGFTTQKLAWGSAYGVPFDIGKWYGVDGNFVYASLNPHDYYFTLTKLRNWDFVQNKIKENEKYGLDWTYMFHGIGDRGGAPKEATVRFVDEEIKKNDSEEIEVISAYADQIYRDIKTELPKETEEKLPTWNNELVMQNHGVGGYTSRAIGKRWNAKCQELADMAERVGVMSMYHGTSEYNEAVLEKSWKRAIAHQFHDDTPGTSVQRAYRRSWNDYAMSINQFSGELEASLGAVSQLMKSDYCKGIPLLVTNPVEADRKSVVRIKLSDIDAPYVRVFDNKGREVASQIVSEANGVKEIIFLAEIKSLGLKVFDARPSDEPCKIKSKLIVTDNSLENDKYIVTINKNGDITSIIDKTDEQRELLEKPIVLGLYNYTGSKDWPAWEMNYDEANKEPDRTPKLVSFKIAENGPVRVAFEIKQRDKKSEFTTYICLTKDSEIVEIYNKIEWQSMRTLLKNRFSLTASNPKATFDLGLGAIQRENMNEKLFEVPAQKWADITDESGEFGISIISECKHGWDKYNDNTLRLTAIHTPKRNYRIDSMQSMMDLGKNIYGYAIYSHKGQVGADTQLQSRLYTYPLTAVTFQRHTGKLGGDYSFGNVSTNDVIIRAIKKAHHSDSDEIIVRLNEGANKEIKNFTLTLGDGIESARELYASEEYKGEARVENGQLVCDFKPYEIKTFGITLKKPNVIGEKHTCTPVELDYNEKLIINKGEKGSFKFNVPRSLVNDKITVGGVTFAVSSDKDRNALSFKGQTIKTNGAKQVKILCACVDDDEEVTFLAGDREITKTINHMSSAYARWDLYDLGETAYIKDGNLGFEATHALDDKGNIVWAKGLYFWVVSIDTDSADEITLPSNPDCLALAISLCDFEETKLATPTIDEIENNRPLTFHKNFKESVWYILSKCVWNLHDRDNFLTHWNNGKNGRRVEQTGKRAANRTVESVGH